MNAAQTGVENLDLEKLNDKDKAELRQFLANEQQRSQIQSRKFVHGSTIPGPTRRHLYYRPRSFVDITG